MAEKNRLIRLSDSNSTYVCPITKSDGVFMGDGNTTLETKMNEVTSQLEQNKKDLNARMDTFTSLKEGSTTGDAELIDGRIKHNGLLSSSIGTSIREQFSELKTCLDYKASKNLWNPNLIFKKGSLNSADGTISESNDYYVSEVYIPVLSGKTVFFSLNGVPATIRAVCCYDYNKKFISYGASFGKSFEIPSNAKFIRVANALNMTIESYKPQMEYDEVTSYEPYFEPYYEVKKLSVDLYDKVLKYTREYTDIPDYWLSHLNEKINIIKNLQLNGGYNCSSFGFITDIHVGNNAQKSPFLLEKIMNECDIPYYFDGGDFVTGASNTSKDKNIEEIRLVKKLYKKLEDKCLRTIGNHDDNSIDNEWIDTVTDKEMYSEIQRFNCSNPKFTVGKTGQYYFADDNVAKIRYITLNCIDIPYQKNGDAPLFTGMNVQAFRQEQLEWFANIALKVPSNEWGVVVCSHVPINYGIIINDSIAMNILQAFKNKTVYKGSNHQFAEFAVDINVDFTNNGGEVICWIAGHIHADKFVTLPSNITFKEVTTLNDSLHVATGQPTKTKGTITEQAFDIFTINKETRTVNITRIGAGSDRSFTY